MSLTYILAKKKAKKEFMLELSKAYINREKVVANTNLWCEFCMKGKRRWDVKLVGVENLDKITDEFLKGVLEKPDNDIIFACEPCIEKLGLQPLKNERGGIWDGQGEALKEVMQLGNPHAK